MGILRINNSVCPYLPLSISFKHYEGNIMNILPLSFSIEGLTLRGSLYLPQHVSSSDQPQPLPTALLFHGFGGNRVDVGRFIVQMATALTQQGMAVVTYDRAGHGESDGSFFDTSISKDAHHALQVIRQIASLDWVDADNMHFAGLSLGAVITSLAAAQCEQQQLCAPKSIVMCSTAAVCVDEIRSGYIQGKPLDTLKTVGYFDFIGVKMGPAMVEDARDLDLYTLAQPYTGKALLLHGTEDFVPVQYAERYRDMWGANAQLLIRQGADHGWATVPDREFVMSHTAQFIAEHAGLTYVPIDLWS